MTDEAKQIENIINEIEDYAESLVKGITLNVTNELIHETPKDSGFAAANWIPAIGEPDDELPIGSRSNVGAAAGAQAAGVAEIATYKLEQGKTTISNGVLYVNPLNAGQIGHNPGFVERAINDGVRKTAR